MQSRLFYLVFVQSPVCQFIGEPTAWLSGPEGGVQQSETTVAMLILEIWMGRVKLWIQRKAVMKQWNVLTVSKVLLIG